MLHATERVIPDAATSATQGRIRWEPRKSLWTLAHMTLGIAGVALYPHWDAAAVFVVLTAITICTGHSVGMHRLLIHRSFAAPRWLEVLLVWLGTLVGMAGPMGMIRAHDMRDWHQRQAVCPPHPSHAAGFWRDIWWQMHCHFPLTHPPRFEIEAEVAGSRIYRWMEATWMLQQLPVAVLLWVFGGWAWVLWGISLQIWVSLTGHWLIGHYAHHRGHQGRRIAGLPVQGYNLPGLGLVTFGENWHANHHAFPHSARLGVERGQTDPGFWLIKALEALGLARDIQLPGSQPPRAGLTRV
ncbi:MAG: acyl-CoA desaturase [Pseudomonadota bacterium]